MNNSIIYHECSDGYVAYRPQTASIIEGGTGKTKEEALTDYIKNINYMIDFLTDELNKIGNENETFEISTK